VSGRTIKRLNYLGEPLPYEPARPSPSWSPGHLLITAEGDYVTVDRSSGLVAKHDARTGDLLWTMDLAEYIPDDAGLAGRPVEAPDGRLYIPGGGSRKVVVLSAQGEFLSSFGTTGTTAGTFAFPVGIAFGPGGAVLVLDRMRHTILVFSADHKFVTEFGTLGDGPGLFYHPVAIASAPDGQVYVAQGHRGLVQIFRMVESENLPDRQGG
jgi:outer membrane protein assembly factor BamB